MFWYILSRIIFIAVIVIFACCIHGAIAGRKMERIFRREEK